MHLTLRKKISYTVISVLIIVLLTVQSPLFGTPFTYLPIVLMVAGIAAVIMFLGTLVYDIIKKTKNSVNFLLVIIVTLASFWGSLKIVDMQLASTKLRAETINTAIDKYFDDKKEYPEKLDDLAPGYLAEIPKTDMGLIKEKFEYKRFGKDNDYWLSFEELFKAKWIYIKSREAWTLND